MVVSAGINLRHFHLRGAQGTVSYWRIVRGGCLSYVDDLTNSAMKAVEDWLVEDVVDFTPDQN